MSSTELSAMMEAHRANIQETAPNRPDVVYDGERFNITKNKKSQANDSVNNVLVIHDTLIDVKYTVAFSATAVQGPNFNKDNDEHKTEVGANLIDIQSLVSSFLGSIKDTL